MFNQKSLIRMRTNRFALATLTFIAGIFLGVSAIALYSFTNTTPSPSPLPGVNKINIQEANTLFNRYFENASPNNEIIKGYTFNKEQISAINALLNENQGLAGFRIYMGYDNNNANVGIIVGVNGSGQDVTNTIYRSAGQGSGPCPTICDGGSSIVNN